jgi:hypothetical protein
VDIAQRSVVTRQGHTGWLIQPCAHGMVHCRGKKQASNAAERLESSETNFGLETDEAKASETNPS